jgi:DNA-binding NarL/FixJ family response regulator
VVDDEPHARRGIVLRLQRHPDFQLIGECGHGKSALQSIERRTVGSRFRFEPSFTRTRHMGLS